MKKIRKKLCVIASSRATYGYKKKIIKLFEKSKKIDLDVIVTGMHLAKDYGYSVSELIKDKVPISYKLDIKIHGDKKKNFTNSLGIEISGLSKIFNKVKPDLTLVTGDRGEMFAASLASAYMGIPIAHIQAGDVSGHIDGSARHAITKLSHLHFASCKDSYNRVIKLGEEKWRVHNVGAPQLDDMINIKKISRNNILKEYNLDTKEKYAIFIQHPVLEEIEYAKFQIEESLKAIKRSNIQTILVYPNIDSGNMSIIKCINKYKSDKIKIFKNIPRNKFISLLKNTNLIIGNSSCGILEAPTFKIPAINIGNRQKGRLQGTNVINCDYDSNMIFKKINYALNSKNFHNLLIKCKNPYGDGKSSQRIVKIIEDITNFKALFNKSITY